MDITLPRISFGWGLIIFLCTVVMFFLSIAAIVQSTTNKKVSSWMIGVWVSFAGLLLINKYMTFIENYDRKKEMYERNNN